MSSLGRPKPSLLQRLKTDLRANPRKKVALFTLGPLVVLAWVPLLKGGSSSAPPPVTELPTAEAPATGLDADAPARPVDLELRARLGAVVADLGAEWTPSWTAREGDAPFGATDPNAARGGRFPTPGDNRSRANRLTREEELTLAESFRPTSTFLSEKHGNVAIIDGSPYRDGDELEHFVIQEIKTRALLLKGRLGEYELQISSDQEDRR